MGRSAPARLKRTLELAKSFNLSLPTLEDIASQIKQQDKKSLYEAN
jgi:hypothetical protein